MRTFVGRERELASLRKNFDGVQDKVGAAKPGRLLMVRGRRRVGKSTLLEEFIDRTGCPALFFTASRQTSDEPRLFAEELAESSLPGANLAEGQRPNDWNAALRLLAAALPDDQVSIVVIDEFPYLIEADRSIEAVFQKVWDRQLRGKPVLLVLVGSDLAMMEHLDDADRALHQRGTEMILRALNPREAGQIVGAATASDALDAYLVTGGLPLVCDQWPTGMSLWDYLAETLAEPTSALIVSAERSLRAELPAEASAELLLGEIGSGAVTFSRVARAGGGMSHTVVVRGLELLQAKRLVTRDVPLSTKPSREARYRVADPYLQFWLRFIGPHLPEIERGRGDLVLDRIRRDWTAWRGRAVEPVIHEALACLLPIAGTPEASVVGGYWTRTNNPEVDIVGADGAPVAKKVAFTGTIKWHDTAPLDQADIAKLIVDSAAIPGVTRSTPQIAVSRTGADVHSVAAVLGPDDLIDAWGAP